VVTPAAVWPAAEVIETERLLLEPLRADHAVEMAAVLDDERLHAFIGGRPATLEELRARFIRLVAGQSADGSQGWLNWVVRHRRSGVAVGTVQATLRSNGAVTAEVAWVIAAPHQRRGYAKEASAAMTVWLCHRGVEALVAHVHPTHEASIRVARHLGLTPTDMVEDGEVRWTADRASGTLRSGRNVR
jgi:RimJ/RimL family protein N-acetyltransferase